MAEDFTTKWSDRPFEPKFALVDGVMLEWKDDHWEDENGDAVIVTIGAPSKLGE